MLFNKNHVVLLTTTFIMFLIESQLGQYIGWDILARDAMIRDSTIIYSMGPVYDILHYMDNDVDNDEYKKILIYISIQNTNITLIYINLFYMYFGILNIIIRDMDLLVNVHILYFLIVISLKYEYITIEYTNKTILSMCGCLYIHNKLYKLYLH
jgi:hypothetical protein